MYILQQRLFKQNLQRIKKFSDNDINKFALQLINLLCCVYLYEYMDKLNMEDIANSDQMHAKRIYKHLKIKKKIR